LHESRLTWHKKRGAATHHDIDLIGSGSDEEVSLYLKYYADEDERQRWIQDFPDIQVPDRERRPAMNP